MTSPGTPPPRAQIDHSAVDTLEGGDEATGMFDDLVDWTLTEKAKVLAIGESIMHGLGHRWLRHSRSVPRSARDQHDPKRDEARLCKAGLRWSTWDLAS